jgi:hypothetical protein
MYVVCIYIYIYIYIYRERERERGVTPVSRVIRSKSHRASVKPRIILNAIYNVIFV